MAEPVIPAVRAVLPAAADGNRGLRPQRTQAERSETTQKKVLDAAIQLLRQRGYGGLRTSEVRVFAIGALIEDDPDVSVTSTRSGARSSVSIWKLISGRSRLPTDKHKTGR